VDCVNCGAPLPPKTTRCSFCQTLNDVDLRGRITFERGTTKRDCPRCGKALTAVVVRIGAEAVELDRCKACHGLFFDPGELDAVLDGIETRAETVDHRQLLTLIEEETPTEDFHHVTYLPCPDCGQLMNRRIVGRQSGVISDSCREHGTWLDGGELRQLIRWTQAGGRRHHAVQEAEKRRLEARLRKTPTAEPAAPLSETSADSGSGSLFGGFDGAFDVVDVVRALGSLFRGSR
jgi:Zn-finger nucleic acid-binding protein